jgi:hypothetical protein
LRGNCVNEKYFARFSLGRVALTRSVLALVSSIVSETQ